MSQQLSSILTGPLGLVPPEPKRSESLHCSVTIKSKVITPWLLHPANLSYNPLVGVGKRAGKQPGPSVSAG